MAEQHIEAAGECGCRKALERIRKWFGEFPSTTWPDGREMPYGVAFGSNGERDYMRSVAHEALATPCHCTELREQLATAREDLAEAMEMLHGLREWFAAASGNVEIVRQVEVFTARYKGVQKD